MPWRCTYVYIYFFQPLCFSIFEFYPYSQFIRTSLVILLFWFIHWFALKLHLTSSPMFIDSTFRSKTALLPSLLIEGFAISTVHLSFFRSFLPYALSSDLFVRLVLKVPTSRIYSHFCLFAIQVLISKLISRGTRSTIY